MLIGHPLPGVTTRVEPLGASSDVGELLLRSPSLAAARSGPNGREPLTRSDGWYPTGDLAATGAGGGIRLIGRASAVINVAGEKASPGRIEQVPTAHPHVADAQVFRTGEPTGEDSGVVYLRAASVAVPHALPPQIRRGLPHTDEPIGRLLRRH